MFGILATVEPAQASQGANAILQIAGQFGIKPHLLLAQIVNFTIVALILNFFVIKPIQKNLDERAKAIDEGLKRSEESQQMLEKARHEREEIVAAARKEVQTLVERTQKEIQQFEATQRSQAQKEATEIIENAKRSLAMENEQQIAKAQKELAALVVRLAEKSLEETLQDDQKNRFTERVTAVLAKK